MIMAISNDSRKMPKILVWRRLMDENKFDKNGNCLKCKRPYGEHFNDDCPRGYERGHSEGELLGYCIYTDKKHQIDTAMRDARIAIAQIDIEIANRVREHNEEIERLNNKKTELGNKISEYIEQRQNLS